MRQHCFLHWIALPDLIAGVREIAWASRPTKNDWRRVRRDEITDVGARRTRKFPMEFQRSEIWRRRARIQAAERTLAAWPRGVRHAARAAGSCKGLEAQSVVLPNSFKIRLQRDNVPLAARQR